MGFKRVPQPPHSPDLAPCDFWLFSKLRGRRYETIEEIKEAVTKVIDTLTQEDFHGAFQKLLEQYNKCISAGGDYFEGDLSFMCVLSINVPIRKNLETYRMHLVPLGKGNNPLIPTSHVLNCITAVLFWWICDCWYVIKQKNLEIEFFFLNVVTLQTAAVLVIVEAQTMIKMGRKKKT